MLALNPELSFVITSISQLMRSQFPQCMCTQVCFGLVWFVFVFFGCFFSWSYFWCECEKDIGFSQQFLCPMCIEGSICNTEQVGTFDPDTSEVWPTLISINIRINTCFNRDVNLTTFTRFLTLKRLWNLLTLSPFLASVDLTNELTTTFSWTIVWQLKEEEWTFHPLSYQLIKCTRKHNTKKTPFVNCMISFSFFLIQHKKEMEVWQNWYILNLHPTSWMKKIFSYFGTNNASTMDKIGKKDSFMHSPHPLQSFYSFPTRYI